MTDREIEPLTDNQLAILQKALQEGAKQASQALAIWLGKPSLVEVDSLEHLPIAEATSLLPSERQPICFCSLAINGVLNGQMIFAFDDTSGLTLADILLEQSVGTSTEWTEMAMSVALETANIVCCAYLNALSDRLRDRLPTCELIPGPPTFSREFAESLMQFALMAQALEFDEVILAKTRFQIDQVPVDWILLFVPDAESTCRMARWLSGSETQ